MLCDKCYQKVYRFLIDYFSKFHIKWKTGNWPRMVTKWNLDDFFRNVKMIHNHKYKILLIFRQLFSKDKYSFLNCIMLLIIFLLFISSLKNTSLFFFLILFAYFWNHISILQYEMLEKNNFSAFRKFLINTANYFIVNLLIINLLQWGADCIPWFSAFLHWDIKIEFYNFFAFPISHRNLGPNIEVNIKHDSIPAHLKKHVHEIMDEWI